MEFLAQCESEHATVSCLITAFEDGRMNSAVGDLRGRPTSRPQAEIG